MVDIFRRPRLTVTQNVLTFRKSYSLVIVVIGITCFPYDGDDRSADRLKFYVADDR